MNAKRVKSFRQSLRELGHNWRGVDYLSGKPKFQGVTGTIILDPKCGRAMYQAAKREARAA